MYRLRRWQWIALGLVVGLSLGSVRQRLADQPGTISRNLGQERFENELSQPPVDGKPVLNNIVLYPLEGGRYRVKMQRLVHSPDAKDPAAREYQPWEWEPHDRAYRPLRDAPKDAGPDYTIVSYLKDMSAKYPHVKFRQAWWSQPRIALGLWTIAGMMLIGGIWPSFLNRFGAAPREAAQEPYDLDRFKPEPPPESKPVQNQHVMELDEELSAALAEFNPALPESNGQPAPTPITLSNAPLSPCTAEPSREDKEFAGEFYPVARKPQR